MSLRRPKWWKDCLAYSWRDKQRGKLNSQFTEPEGKYYELPEAFKKQYYDRITHEQEPVHYELDPGRWEKDPETGEYRHVENRPIPVIYPVESQRGLWGGEGVIKGYYRRQDRNRIWAQPKIWWPWLYREVFHSEILAAYYLITCTRRTLNLVDDCHGFDHYILKTHEVDLKSKLGIKLKKMMLSKLLELEEQISNQKLEVPEDVQKTYNRYKRYMVTAEEIEWMDLTPNQALIKYIRLEEARARANRQPLKEAFRQELLEEFESEGDDESDTSQDSSGGVTGSLMSKLRSLGAGVSK